MRIVLWNVEWALSALTRETILQQLALEDPEYSA